MGAELNSTGLEDEGIYEPLIVYKNIYKDLHHKNTTEFFDALVEKSKIDLQLNKETNGQIKKFDTERKEIISRINKRTAVNVFLILLIVASVIGIFYGISVLSQSGYEISYVVLIIIGIGLIISSIILLVKLSPKLKELKILKTNLNEKIGKLTEKAWEQMQPLNDLFTPEMSKGLFSKTIPLINLDKMFDSKRLEYLVNKFGLDEVKDINRSTLYVQSGDINGNPFYVCNDMVHELGTKTYTGSITIHWTTTSNVNGKSVTNHHSQTLTASVNKPCPYYGEKPYLVYGNEAAPDLIFSRHDSDSEQLNQKQIDKLVNRDIKKLNKESEKSISKGGNYTVLGNSEFEVLFGATNRNNEVQFRLLFTPLAQKQLLQLMKEKEIGFGDDFDLVKHKMINIIYPEHLRDINLNTKANYFHGYDLDEVKNKFICYNDAYFKHLYFTFAPILAIPLYQQQKPHEYIYKELYDSYVSFYEHEFVANNMNINAFKHPLSVTQNILKTSVVKSKDNCDTVTVTAFGYQTEERVDYMTKMGGDGRSHTIPVRWTEYIPVSQNTDIDINIVDEVDETTYSDKFKQVIENLRDKENLDERDIYRVGLFLSYITKK
ncbi:MAG: hypothetical protein K0Q49_72 [Haloplasmataceae bacterium]|nr:hypothetical protein [Haloplasmataceae bacterium]